MDAGAAAQILGREWGTSLDRLSALAWDRPTRLEGWTVADLAAHLVWGAGLEADGLRRARLGITDPAEGGTPAEGRRDQIARLEETVADLIGEVAASVRTEAAVPMPYGPIHMPLALSIFAMEAAVHGSDLAHAAGDDDTLAPDVIAPTVLVVSGFLPVVAASADPPPPETSYLLVGNTVEMGFVHTPGGWIAERALSPSAEVRGSDSDVVLFALGRRDLDGLEVAGSRDAAKAFKHYLPGL